MAGVCLPCRATYTASLLVLSQPDGTRGGACLYSPSTPARAAREGCPPLALVPHNAYPAGPQRGLTRWEARHLRILALKQILRGLTPLRRLPSIPVSRQSDDTTTGLPTPRHSSRHRFPASNAPSVPRKPGGIEQ
jgi:hypothetical protein